MNNNSENIPNEYILGPSGSGKSYARFLLQNDLLGLDNLKLKESLLNIIETSTNEDDKVSAKELLKKI